MNILVTGMSGLIGGLVRARLESLAELSALNRQPVDGIHTTRADLADYDAIRPAFDGQDVVVHLAAKAGERFAWEELLQTNVVGIRNSRNRWGYRDLTHAEEAVGFVPQDAAEDHR